MPTENDTSWFDGPVWTPSELADILTQPRPVQSFNMITPIVSRYSERQRLLNHELSRLVFGRVPKLTGAERYEALFPMPAKGDKQCSPKMPLFSIKSCGATNEECLAELHEKLPAGVTPAMMEKGPRFG